MAKTLRLLRLQQLNPIAERIVHIHAVVAFKRLVFYHAESGCAYALCEGRKILYLQRRMSLLCRTKFLVDAEVNAD